MEKSLERSLLFLITAILLFLFGVALFLRLDMYDTYEIFLNAKLIGGDTAGWYFATRSFVMPLIFSPIFIISKYLASDPDSFALAACHLVSMSLTSALIWGVYRLFRIHLSRKYSLLGAALLLCNPLIIHAAPISKEDIPGALFTTWTFYFYLRYWQTGRRKYGLLTALAVVLTMGTRYNVIPLLPLVMAAHEILNSRGKFNALQFLRKAALLTLVPTVIWLMVASLLYFRLKLAPLTEAPAKFLSSLYHASVGATGSEMGYPEYPWENLVFMVRSYSISIFVLSLWGMVIAWRKKSAGAIFHGLWFTIFLLFHSFALGHKEARYLFCFFPPLYFFAVIGIRELVRLAKRRTNRALAMAVVLAMPLYNATAEGLKFSDPFYRVNFAREVSRYAASLAGKKQIRWFGPFYAMHPKDFIFDPEDEVTYLYHFYVHTVRYYTGKTMFAFPRKIQLSSPGIPENGIFPPPELGIALGDGDAVILNPEVEHYVTKSVPTVLKPLVVERTKVLQFEKTGEGTFQALKPGNGRIEAKHTATGTEFKTSGLSPSSFELFVELSDGRKGTAGSFDASRGGQPRTLAQNILPSGVTIKNVWLLSFDSVKLFTGRAE